MRARRLPFALLMALLSGCADAGDVAGTADPPTAYAKGIGSAEVLQGVDGLAEPMARSVTAAIEAAGAEGVPLEITSGFRTAEQQERLYREAVAAHGSAGAARRWVLPPGESAHVTGEAVDVGPASAAAWLAERGVEFGLCQRYANEPWHFERLAGALGSDCPALEPHP